MNAGAEFYLVKMEKPVDTGEPIETEGGIFIPHEIEVPSAAFAEVVAVGDFTTANAKVGDTIYFNPFMATLVKDNIYAVADKQVIASE